MPVGRVGAAPIARSRRGSGVRTTLHDRGHLHAVAARAIVVVVPMRQHSCHSAAARSAAGAPAGGAGAPPRAGTARAPGAAAGACGC